jgi:type VI secretion system secreted protein VgrG
MLEFRIDTLRAKVSVAGFRGIEAISTPYEFELEVSSRSSTLARHLGSRAHLSWSVGSTKAVRHGVVGRVTMLRSTGAGFTYQVTLVPALTTLALRSNCRIFQDKTSIEVVETILDEHGIDSYQTTLEGNYQTQAYVVQYRESDLAFIQRLLEEEGIFYYFEHTRSDHTLIVADSAPGYQPISGSSKLMYGKPLPTEERVSELTLSNTAATDLVRLRDYNFESPAANLEVTRKVPGADGEAELYDYPGRFTVRNDGFARARMRLDSERTAALSAAATTNSPRLAPGRTFRLAGHPYKSANQTYVALRTTHEATADGTADEMPYRSVVECTTASATYRSARHYPSLVMDGPQTATVVGPAGEEIHIDEYGRVKVQFHWDREGQSNEHSSAWIRVAQAVAGDGWGTLTIPRIGHEVLVAFVDGDPHRPVIIGSLYNGANQPPVELPDNKAQTIFKTRSTPGGAGFNQLTFDDTAGNERVSLSSARALDVAAGGDSTESVAGDRISAIGGDQILETGGDFTHRVGSDHTITTGADFTHAVSKSIDLEAGDKVTIRVGAASLVLKANGAVTINGTRVR